MSDAKADRLAPWQGALVLVTVGLGAQVAGGVVLIVAALIAAARGDVSMDSLMSQGGLTFGILAPSLLATGLVMAGGSVLAVALAGRSLRGALALRGAPLAAFVAAPIGILALGPTSDALRRLMQTYAPALTFGSLEGLDAVARSAPVWVVAPLFAFVPGIAEELLFRGAFQRSIRTRWLAIVLSGFFFAAYHTDPHHVVAVLPLGFYLAWLGDRTGSVLVPITAHVVNNGMAVIVITLLDVSEPSELDLVAVPVGWVVAASAALIVYWATRRAGARAAPSLD